MPVTPSLMNMAVAGYTGKDPFEWHYEATTLLPEMTKLAQRLYSDTCPFMPPVIIARPAGPYQIMKSQSFVLAENGCVQHPEVVGMTEDEYPELIEKGFDYLLDKVVPRQYKGLDPKDPMKMAYNMQLAINERANEMQAFMPGFMQLCGMMGYHSGGTLGSSGAAEAPFDFLSDQLRSFSGITIDIRRRREEVKAACEVLTPLMYKMGRPPFVDYQANVFYPLHLPTFMRAKDVEELYMPSFTKIIQQDVARGIRPYIALEDDWTRLLDIVYDKFPAGCVFWIDEGDPKFFKEKLGKKYLLNGLYRISWVKSLSTPELLDKTKEFMDIMLDGCGYVWGFDKNPLMACDLDFDKLCEVTAWLHENCNYANAGEPFGTKLNSEGYAADPRWDEPIKSDYVFNWEKFKAENPLAPDYSRPKFEMANAQTYAWFMNLMF